MNGIRVKPDWDKPYLGCYSRGWHWRVTRLCGVSVYVYDIKKDGLYTKYSFGDIIYDQYFHESHWLIREGHVELIPENNLRSIDDLWE